MNRFFRGVCMVLAVVIALAIPAAATETATPYASNFFAASSTYLYKTSSTTFEVWFDIDAVGTMQKLGASEIRVQRSSDNVNWTTVRTYTDDLYPHLMDTNSRTHDGYVTYTGSTGYYYRAFVIYYAENSSGYGEAYRYTASLKL